MGLRSLFIISLIILILLKKCLFLEGRKGTAFAGIGKRITGSELNEVKLGNRFRKLTFGKFCLAAGL